MHFSLARDNLFSLTPVNEHSREQTAEWNEKAGRGRKGSKYTSKRNQHTYRRRKKRSSHNLLFYHLIFHNFMLISVISGLIYNILSCQYKICKIQRTDKTVVAAVFWLDGGTKTSFSPVSDGLKTPHGPPVMTTVSVFFFFNLHFNNKVTQSLSLFIQK